MSRRFPRDQYGPDEAYIDIVFDGEPGHEGPRFIEVEAPDGSSLSLGEWVQRDDGYWVIRINPAVDLPTCDCLRNMAGGIFMADKECFYHRNWRPRTGATGTAATTVASDDTEQKDTHDLP